MSLTENSNELFLPGGATELKILDLAPRPYIECRGRVETHVVRTCDPTPLL